MIISKNSINKYSYIVAKITSVIRADEFSFQIKPTDIDRELNYDSEVRTNELFTVSETIILKKFASFNKATLKNLTESVKSNLSIDVN